MRLGFAISLWHLFRGAFWSENLVWKIMRQSWGHMPTFQGMFWLWGCTSYYRSFFPHLLSLQKCFRLFFCRNLPKMRSVEKSGKKRVDVSNRENGTHCIYNSSSRFEPQQRSGTHGFTRLAPMWLRTAKTSAETPNPTGDSRVCCVFLAPSPKVNQRLPKKNATWLSINYQADFFESMAILTKHASYPIL